MVAIYPATPTNGPPLPDRDGGNVSSEERKKYTSTGVAGNLKASMQLLLTHHHIHELPEMK